MAESNYLEVLGCPCLSFSDIAAAKSYTLGILQSGRGGYSVAINAEKIILFDKSDSFKEIVNQSNLPLPDGAGAVLGMKLLHKSRSIKLDFPKLVFELAHENAFKVFILGSSEDVNSKAYAVLAQKYPNIQLVGRLNGYFESKEVVFEKLKDSKPDIVMLALGSPKQEIFAHSIYKDFPNILFVGCGGALDILSGRIKRAPKFFIENNLEWFFRLALQPKRIRRQKNLPLFLGRLLKAYFKKK
jgi:N-acetylglucosaminyldiphosphoundecaprenol N-acetyl-beta-D-mannosaminyltransferase